MAPDDKIASTIDAALDETAATAASPVAPAGELAPGTKLDRYVIERRLGAGAMGVVYAARDPELDRLLAIKLLKPRVGGDVQRLRREAQALARMSHPNVVTVHDVGPHGAGVFVAMELVRGETLRDWLARGQPVEAILERLKEAGRGLAAAHAAGLVHRDFKPDNVLVGDDGRARVTDFGLARLDEMDDVPPSPASPLSVELTSTGTMLGTPVYAAPEQLAAERVDARADVFGFCATAYEALFGVRPFRGDSIPQLIDNARMYRLTPPQKTPDLEGGIREVIERGLMFDPAQRPQSIDEVLAAFEPPKRRSVPLVAVLGGAAALAAAIVVFVVTRSHAPSCDASHALDGVWDETIAKRARFVGDASRHRARMDQYAHGWIAASERICRADIPEGTRKARLGCLDEAKQFLKEVSTMFVSKDIDDATAAWAANVRLINVELCDSSTFPTGANLEEVVAARGRMFEAMQLLLAGQPQEAKRIALEIEAAHIDNAVLLAELTVLFGDIAAVTQSSEVTIAYYRKAMTLSETGGFTRIKSTAAVKLAFTLLRSGRVDEAQSTLELAEAMNTQADGFTAAMIVDLHAGLADARGNTDEAIRLYREAIAHHKAQEDVAAAANSQIELAGVYSRVGKLDEAKALRDEAMRVAKVALPSLDNDHCTDDLQAGNLTAALDSCRETARKAEAGGETTQLASAIQGHAIALDMTDQYEEARARYLRAAAIQEKLKSPVEAAFNLEMAGRASIELTEYDKAIADLKRAVELAKGNASQTMYARATLGRAYSAAGKSVEAIVELEAVIPELEKIEQKNVLASARFALAGALKDRKRAREEATKAKAEAEAFRDRFDEVGINAVYRKAMNKLIDRIDRWLKSH